MKKKPEQDNRPFSTFLRFAGLGTGKIFKNTELELFEALLQSWGFKRSRTFTKSFDFDKRYVKASPKEDRSYIIFTLSGGPMVLFEKKTGKFVEWA